MSRERALLRRYVKIDTDLRNGCYGGKTEEYLEENRQWWEDVYALLAEPEGDGDIEALVEKVQNLRSMTGWVLARESDALCEEIVSEIRSLHRPTPRSRAEVEAMVEELDDSAYALGAAEERDDHVTAAVQRKRATTARAALLAALTGEGT